MSTPDQTCSECAYQWSTGRNKAPILRTACPFFVMEMATMAMFLASSSESSILTSLRVQGRAVAAGTQSHHSGALPANRLLSNRYERMENSETDLLLLLLLAAAAHLVVPNLDKMAPGALTALHILDRALVEEPTRRGGNIRFITVKPSSLLFDESCFEF